MPDSVSAPVIRNVTAPVCHVPGSGASLMLALGEVLSTLTVAASNVAPGMPDPETARALTVTVPSGRSVNVVVAGANGLVPSVTRASITASGSEPSVVTAYPWTPENRTGADPGYVMFCGYARASTAFSQPF